MQTEYHTMEIVLGPAIKVLDDNGMSSKIYSIKFPKKHEDIDLNPRAKYKEHVTNVLDKRPNHHPRTRGYYTNKRSFISYQEFILLSNDLIGK